MDTTQKLIAIQAIVLVGYGVFRLYLFLFNRAKANQE